MSKFRKTNNLKAMIGPSLLACDMSRMAEEGLKVMKCGAGFLHLDVMDGHFVPNLTFGAPIISCLRENVPKDTFLDVHLMVTDPNKWIDDMANAGANMFTFHIEAVKGNADINSTIEKIKDKGMKVGIAVKPGTSIDEVIPFVPQLDLVLVMTVEPGFGGQKFQATMMDKVKTLRQQFPSLDIEVDGGLGPSTIDIAAQSGANWIVAGSSVFKAEHPEAVITELREAVQKYI